MNIAQALWVFFHCFRLYRKIFQKQYGAESGEQMLHDLEVAVAKYNTDNGAQCAQMSQVNGKIVIGSTASIVAAVNWFLLMRVGEWTVMTAGFFLFSLTVRPVVFHSVA